MLLAVFMTIVSSIPLVPLVDNVLNELPKKVLAYYPDPLVVRIDKGEVSTNVSLPYYLPIPEEIRTRMATSGDILYLGVIDTETPVSLSQFKAYQAGFWLSKEYLVVDDGSGGIRVTKFGPQVNYTLNESILKGLMDTIQPFFKFVAPALVLMIFIGMLISFVVNQNGRYGRSAGGSSGRQQAHRERC